MRLPIHQMTEGENSLVYDSRQDPWLEQMRKSLGSDGYKIITPITAQLQITKLEPDYYLRGKITCTVEQTCARCAEQFPLVLAHSFEIAMAHVSQTKVNRVEVAEESEELDIHFFEGNEVDLEPLLREQFVLSIPYQAVCRPDCRGICQKCGKNLATEKCVCGAPLPSGPFAVLQGLKV